MMKPILSGAAALAALMLPALPALAEQTAAQHPFYVGGSLTADASDWDDFVKDKNPSNAVDKNAEGGVGGQVYAGYSFASYFSGRVGYRIYGNQSVDMLVITPPSTISRRGTSLDVSGFFVEADALYPLTPNLSLGATLGWLDWDADVNSGSGKVSSSDSDFYWGLRGRFYPGDVPLSLDAFVQQLRLKDSDVQGNINLYTFGVGANYHF
jgi:hypothetical protein